LRRLIVLSVLLLGALPLAATGLADPGPGGTKSKSAHHSKYTFTVTTTDNGSCGTAWATDVVKRTFRVKKNRDGSYTLTRFDRGRFTTIGGVSPGACDTTGRHGHTVRAGVTGRMVGFLRGKVTGGTFDPSA
jgi:hypothetical protein